LNEMADLLEVTNYGTITGEGNNDGGIAGYHRGTIIEAINHGTVFSPGPFVAGIAGYNEDGTIQKATNHGNVASSDSHVGGIAGTSSSASNIERACNLGSVTGGDRAGGLVGSNGGSISKIYDQGSVEGVSQVGGLIGINSGTVDVSYSGGRVVGSGTDIGALAGSNTGTITNSFWDNETSGQVTSAGGIAKSTGDMMRTATFTKAGWDFESLWAIRPTHTYPFFTWMDWNLAPLPMDDAYQLISDGPTHMLEPSLLANDSDLDRYVFPTLDPKLRTGYTLSVVAFDELSSRGASVHVHGDGGFIYDPSAVPSLWNLSLGEQVIDTFTYTLGDDLGGTATANVTLTVKGWRTAPTIETLSMPEGVVGTAYALLLSASDNDGDDLVWSMKSNATWLEMNGTVGWMSGIPTQAGSFWVLVTVSDGTGRTDQANLTLTVQPNPEGDGDRDDRGSKNDKVPLWAYGSLVAALFFATLTTVIWKRR